MTASPPKIRAPEDIGWAFSPRAEGVRRRFPGGLGATSLMAAPWNTLSSLPAIPLNLSSVTRCQARGRRQHPEIPRCTSGQTSPYLHLLHARGLCPQNTQRGWPGGSLQRPLISEFWEKKTVAQEFYSQIIRYPDLGQQTEFLSLSFILVQAAMTEYRLGGLSTTKCIFSQPWRLAGRGQGASTVGVWWGASS